MNSSNMPLKDKVAIITGAGRGIGKSIATTFAAAGAAVVVVDIDAAEIEKAVAEVKLITSRVLGIKTDVTKKGEVDEMAAKVLQTFGTIDILVNNAAIEYYVPMMLMREEGWDKTFDVNVKGYFLCAQAASKTMIKNNRGIIINFASMGGFLADKYSGAYCATKAAIMHFSRALAVELASHHIRVNCIAPGIVRTRMAAGALKDDDTKKRFESVIPLGRFAEPEEMASVALFLASDASSYITGSTITADGGVCISGMNYDEMGKDMPDKYKV
jgi:NAD(P)-dependent dehydrogenase (short-subunit alcohol dehydrogenase family)